MAEPTARKEQNGMGERPEARRSFGRRVMNWLGYWLEDEPEPPEQEVPEQAVPEQVAPEPEAPEPEVPEPAAAEPPTDEPPVETATPFAAVEEPVASAGPDPELRDEVEERVRDATERVRAEAAERTQREVEAAREAAEQRFAAELRRAREGLEQERDEKTSILVDSERRLREIDAQAAAALERLTKAERDLVEQATRLSEDVGRQATEEAPQSEPDAPVAAPEPEPEPDIPKPVPEPEPEPAAPVAVPGPKPDPEPPEVAIPQPAEPVSLASATFDDLRGLGMSITQAKRVLRYRDQRGISDPEELHQIPGFTEGYLSALKTRLLP